MNRSWRALLVFMMFAVMALGGCSVRSQDNAIAVGASSKIFLDPSGALSFEEARKRDFVPWSESRPVPNRHGAVWLRLPALEGESLLRDGWARPFTVVVKAPRIKHVDLFVVSGAAVEVKSWDWQDSRRMGGNGYRYPVIGLEPDRLTNSEFFLRVVPDHNLEGRVWLTDFQSFVGNYNNETTTLSIAIGVLAAVLIYTFALGATLRSRTNLWFAAVLAAELVHIVTASSTFETQVSPGAGDASIVLALSSRYALQAALIGFALHFLRSGRPGRLVRRLAWSVVGLSVILSAMALSPPEILHRLQYPAAAATILVLLILCASAARRAPMRVAIFVFCWLPALFPIVLAYITWPFMPHFSDGAVFTDEMLLGLCLTYVLFAALASIDIRQREKQLLRQVVHNAERFRGFAEIGTDGFWELDESGRLTFLSGRLAKPVELAVGDRLLDRLDARSTSDYVRPIRETIADRLPLDGRRIRLVDGERDVWVSISGRPIGDPSKPSEEAVYRGVIRDVTEETERESRRVVEQQMLALGQLVGSVAHEVNNLIHPIVNLTKRLRARFAEQADPESLRIMDLIDMSGQQAAKVVSELLQSTRAERWKEIQRPISLAVEYGVEAVRPALPASVRIDVVTEEVARPTVKVGDILQVVGNLLSNAVHAMDGKGRVAISLSRTPEGARLTVSDDGAGMDEDVRRRAMQPFFTTKTDGRGTGVGLYVVQKIVQDYEGWITIDSAPGLGTTFTILFPARQDQDGGCDD